VAAAGAVMAAGAFRAGEVVLSALPLRLGTRGSDAPVVASDAAVRLLVEAAPACTAPEDDEAADSCEPRRGGCTGLPPLDGVAGGTAVAADLPPALLLLPVPVGGAAAAAL
jgi:hypothetical protein